MEQNHKTILIGRVSKRDQEIKKFGIQAFYIMGVGLLLPWNAILAAMDFFKEKYPKRLDYAPDFTFLVAVSLPMLLVQLFAFFFLIKIPL